MQTELFDIFAVGDAAGRGFSVLLAERGDFVDLAAFGRAAEDHHPWLPADLLRRSVRSYGAELDALPDGARVRW
jgi:hypothetical protein